MLTAQWREDFDYRERQFNFGPLFAATKCRDTERKNQLSLDTESTHVNALYLNFINYIYHVE